MRLGWLMRGVICLLLLFYSVLPVMGAEIGSMQLKKEEEGIRVLEGEKQGGQVLKEKEQNKNYSIEQDELLEETMKSAGLSFDEIENNIENSSLGNNISFEKILKKLWQGDTEGIMDDVGNLVKESLFKELSENRKNFAQIILLAIVASLFSNIAGGVFSASLQETGFFTVYLAMSGLVLQSFFLMHSIAQSALSEVFSFMEVLIPAYAIAITMVSGSASSIAVYELTFLLVKACQWGLKTIVVPLIEAYMMVGLINCLGATDKFSNLGNLLKKGTEQFLKWTSALILGLNLIQSMILPAVDSVKSSIWQKGLSAIPGAGAVISALTGSILGAAVLIKNSIGVGCLIILILLCAVPVMKLVVFMLSFHLCSAFLQPISDKRLMNLLHVTGESGKLFLQTVITCLTLFFITIALAAISTNMRYYAG